MAKVRDELGSQKKTTGPAASGFLASATETFNSATNFINGGADSLDDLLGFGPGDKKPLHRSSQLAHKTFGQNETWLRQLNPLLGHQYYVRINYNGALKEFVESYFNETKFEQTFPLVKSVTMPSIGVETEVMNEYNRKRLSQSKLKFDPVDIVFHDTVSGSTLKIWQMYYQHYFADGRFNTKSAQSREAPINPETINFEDFGYDLSQVEDFRYLFKSIEIFQISGGNFNKVTLYNPRIVDFKHDTMAYSSSDLVELSYTFEYEWAEYEFRLDNASGSDFTVSAEDDIKDYLSGGNPLEFEEFKPGYTPGKNEGYPDGFLGDVAEVVDTVQAGIDTIDAAKGVARNIAGRVQSISAFGNQIQKDILGVDEPPFPLPDVRGFTSKIDNIPTNFPDLRRVRKGGG